MFTMGLGMDSEYSRRRIPSPPQNKTTFICPPLTGGESIWERNLLLAFEPAAFSLPGLLTSSLGPMITDRKRGKLLRCLIDRAIQSGKKLNRSRFDKFSTDGGDSLPSLMPVLLTSTATPAACGQFQWVLWVLKFQEPSLN